MHVNHASPAWDWGLHTDLPALLLFPGWCRTLWLTDDSGAQLWLQLPPFPSGFHMWLPVHPGGRGHISGIPFHFESEEPATVGSQGLDPELKRSFDQWYLPLEKASEGSGVDHISTPCVHTCICYGTNLGRHE